MKQIQKVVQKLSREQESAVPTGAYEPVQKHKVKILILKLTESPKYMSPCFDIYLMLGYWVFQILSMLTTVTPYGDNELVQHWLM